MSAVPVARLSELTAGEPRRVDVDGVPVALVLLDDGSLHAVGDPCTHAAVSLSEGAVEDCAVECWLHGSRFDLRSGHPTGLPATQPVATYPVKIDGDDVLVSVTKES